MNLEFNNRRQTEKFKNMHTLYNILMKNQRIEEKSKGKLKIPLNK